MPPTTGLVDHDAPTAVLPAPDRLPTVGFALRCVEPSRWRLEGELDRTSGPLLLTTAEITLPRDPVIFLDCSAVDFIDLAGWRALRRVRLLLEPGTEVRLCHPSRVLRRLIGVVGHP
jgi:ABC-type transporter Mla MlaB component